MRIDGRGRVLVVLLRNVPNRSDRCSLYSEPRSELPYRLDSCASISEFVPVNSVERSPLELLHEYTIYTTALHYKIYLHYV